VTGGGQDKVVHQVSKAGAGANGDTVCVLEPRGAQMLLQRQREVAHPDRGRGDSPALVLGPITEEQWFWQQLVRLSACIGRETHARGGVLLHSGLAAYPGSPPLSRTERTGIESGVLLAGRSGVGKSTAIRRLPSPWDSLADDVTLVVRDEWGMYWAHPWPTWSRFFGEGAGDGSDTWDVQQAVPLWAIFVLEQGEKDRAEPMGPGHAVCLLAELGLQTSTQALIGMPLDEIAAFNLQRFENLCDLVQAVPAYLLDVSLNGTFWEEIERVLELPGVGA
jgi:SynChlorMet cassette protein ScmC